MKKYIPTSMISTEPTLYIISLDLNQPIPANLATIKNAETVCNTNFLGYGLIL
jgi:hypothetical protein